ncbi:MAG: phosphoglucosamine mutase [Gemmatimonadales bacterium]|nr:MAG: phosphoglucosamine mutase [Gemmatimonadales bacterium]
MPLTFPAGLMVSVSGFRGTVGDVLTPELMTTLAAGFGAFLLEEAGEEAGGERLTVLLGRDSRTSGAMIVRAAEAGLQSVGVDVVNIGVAPTPTLLLSIGHHGAAGALGITASHNPAQWNAFKFAGGDGTFLDGDRMTRYLAFMREREIPRAEWDALGGVREDEGAIDRHLERILALPYLELEAIRARRFRIALDCVHGAGGRMVPRLLEALGCEVHGIGLEPDGHFPRDPEPTAANLGDLGDLVRTSGAELGFAVDPDVDRLSLVDGTGRPLGEDLTLALCADVVLRRERGPVVTNLSTSRVVEDVAASHGAPCHRAPVGEINVARRMQTENAVVGGEGNGGIILPALHFTRDAPVGVALLLQHLVDTGGSLADAVDAWPRYHIVKEKTAFPRDRVSAGYDALREALPAPEVDTADGLRLAWPDDGAWLHVRPSGTEPVVRFIAEGRTEAHARELVAAGREALQAQRLG